MNLNYRSLIDNKNRKLVEHIENDLKITITLSRDIINGLPYWSMTYEPMRQTADIFAGTKLDDINAFTHELLHIIQETNGNQSHKTLSTYIYLQPSPFRSCFTNKLVTHINNVILHNRILPDYLSMGFPRNKFVYDYYVKPQLKIASEHIRLINENKINMGALPIFIELFFTYRFHPNFCVRMHYKLIIWRNFSKQKTLQLILNNLCKDWKTSRISTNTDFFNKLLSELDTWKARNNYR